MDFNALSACFGNTDNLTRLEFYIPNLIIGYDNLSMGEQIINQTEIRLDIDGDSYILIISGEPAFNKLGYSNLDAQTRFTTCLSITTIDQELLQFENAEKVINHFMELLYFVYGSSRPWLFARGFGNSGLQWQQIRDFTYNGNANPYSIIPLKYSSVLSEFINSTFYQYYALDNEEKKILSNLFINLSEATVKLNNPKSFILLESALNEFCSSYLLIQGFQEINENLSEKLESLFDTQQMEYEHEWINLFLRRTNEIKNGFSYQEGDYKIFLQMLSLIHKFILKKFSYKGKYWDWSGVSPVIRVI